MSTYQTIVLDTYPLSNGAIPLARPGANTTESERCRQWMFDCEAAGIGLLVPAIAYYEGVRELYQRQATAKIVRFQRYCFNPTRFVPITPEHLTEAGRLWGQMRRTGKATSDPHALDGDCILAAQVLSLNLPEGEFVVATRNVKHLARFGLPADEWENLAP